MDNKKLGVLLMVLGIVIVGIFLYYNQMLTQQGLNQGCVSSDTECVEIERNLSFIHVGIGLFAFLFALGFYILFFNKTEQAILKKLDDEKDNKIKEEKFDIILRALDSYEQKVMKTIKEQDGITQNILRLRTDMSKAKLSYV